jgi:hypothetical protein
MEFTIIRLLFYILTLFLGGAVGVSELVSRYKDAPLRALLTIPAVLYIGLNALAGADGPNRGELPG